MIFQGECAPPFTTTTAGNDSIVNGFCTYVNTCSFKLAVKYSAFSVNGYYSIFDSVFGVFSLI